MCLSFLHQSITIFVYNRIIFFSAPPNLSTPSLAPEDVELISEEEISEAENSPGSPAHANMTVMDKVNDVVPNETLTPSAQEDSLDMDQFEPILSGSSDIESEEEVDLQVLPQYVYCLLFNVNNDGEVYIW